jgi:predicted PurR-regulated permease PerM
LFWNEYFGNIGKVTDRLFENFCEFLGIFCDFFWAVFAVFFVFFAFAEWTNKQLNFLRRRRRRRGRRGRRRTGERWEMSE